MGLSGLGGPRWARRHGRRGRGCSVRMGGAGGRPAAHAGDVVVERDGNGGVEALTNASATPVYLNEFEPTGGLVTTLALPTSVSGSNKPLLDSGTSTSDGEMTLSGNAECLLTVGYDAPLGTEKITETSDKTDPRTVAVVNGKGEINTTTALTDFANENNAAQRHLERMQKNLGRRRRHQNHRRGGRGGSRRHRRGPSSTKTTRTSARWRSWTASSTSPRTRRRPRR